MRSRRWKNRRQPEVLPRDGTGGIARLAFAADIGTHRIDPARGRDADLACERAAAVADAAHASACFVHIGGRNRGNRGVGIEPELLPHIFDRFRQADASARRNFTGLGLGLTIVKGIVEDHGGTIEATPNPEGGTVFRFTLRAVSAKDISDAV